MDYARELIFAYLEEDNTQRAFFRVRPLLTPSGYAQEEAIQLWPDEGGLRIVPDKNEQGYFKDRMREIGSFCLVDLTPFPAEANKIRTNKNYRPERDEKNQYIIFSDTVHELPEHTFYEVLSGKPADYQSIAENAVTPLFLIRDGDTLYGPVRKQSPEQPSTAPEMDAVLFSLPCPDGKVRSILCKSGEHVPSPAPVKSAARPVKKPAEAPADAAPAPVTPPADPVPSPSEIQPADPVPAEPAKSEPAPAAQPDEELPLGKSLQILNTSKGFEETLQDIHQALPSSANLLHTVAQSVPVSTPPKPSAPLTGTPLMRTSGVHTSTPRPKNKTQEVVANQWRAVKNDPPAEPLPSGARMRTLENPVSAACEQLGAAWAIPETHQQLVDYILSLPGGDKSLASTAATTLQEAMQNRLNDIEADRLSALYELDKANADLSAFRAQEVQRVKENARKEIETLEAQQRACHEAADAAKVQLNGLLAQRDALQNEISTLQKNTLPNTLADMLARAQLVAPPSGTPVHLNGRSGHAAAPASLIDVWMQCWTASGVAVNQSAAVAALALLVSCPRIAVVGSTAPAVTLLRNTAAAFGWSSGFAVQTAPEQHPVTAPAPCDSTPLIIASTASIHHPVKDAVRVLLADSASEVTYTAAYRLDPCPIVQLAALPFVPALDAASAQPLSLSALQALAEQNAGDVRLALAPLWKLIPPVSGTAMQQMQRFANVAAALMDGGLQTACDWIIRLWLLPRLIGCKPQVFDQLKPLLTEYPMSAALI